MARRALPFAGTENLHLREAMRLRGIDAPLDESMIVPLEPESPGPAPSLVAKSRWAFARELLALRQVEREWDRGWTVWEGDYPGGGPHRFIEQDPDAPKTAERLGVPGRAWAKEKMATSGREGFISNFGSSFVIDEPLTFDRIEWGPYRDLGPKWGIRSYGTRQGIVANKCWAHRLIGTTDGHWIYASCAGGPYRFEDCLVEECFGQPLQLRSDEDKEGGLHVPTVGGAVDVSGFVVLDCGMGGRGSFPFSFWGMGRPGRTFDFRLSRVWVDNSWPAPSPTSKGATAKGSIMVENHPGYPQRQHGTILLETCFTRLVGSDRGSYLMGADRIFVNGCEWWYETGKGEVVIDRSEAVYADHQPTGKTVWYGNGGNSPVYLGSPKYGGKLIGLAHEDFVIEDGRRRDMRRSDYAELEDHLGFPPHTRRPDASGVPARVA